MKKAWILIFFLFIPSFAIGQDSLDEPEAKRVIINEIAWMGVPVDGVDEKQWWRYEWIELFNHGEEAVSLQGWKLELYSGENLDFTIGLHGSVQASGYFVVGASDKISGVNVNYAILSGKFKNSGQRIVLKDVVGNRVEEIDASNGWIAGDNDLKLTMERRFPDRAVADPENWGSSQNTGGTPGAQNNVFGKEAFLKLDSLQQKQDFTKKDPVWISFLEVTTNGVFMRAFLVAVLSAAAVLVLYRRLVRSPGQSEDSFDAGQD